MMDLVFLTSTTNTDPFAAVAGPIVNLINMAAGPLLAIVFALGVIYCVFLGLKLIKAEEPQDREKAKGALKNAILGFILIFVLIAALNLMKGPLVNWMNKNAGTNISATTATSSK